MEFSLETQIWFTSASGAVCIAKLSNLASEEHLAALLNWQQEPFPIILPLDSFSPLMKFLSPPTIGLGLIGGGNIR